MNAFFIASNSLFHCFHMPFSFFPNIFFIASNCLFHCFQMHFSFFLNAFFIASNCLFHCFQMPLSFFPYEIRQFISYLGNFHFERPCQVEQSQVTWTGFSPKRMTWHSTKDEAIASSSPKSNGIGKDGNLKEWKWFV